jgi:hypothetical protein
MRRGIAFDECCLPPVGQSNRSEFDLAAAGDVVAVDRIEGSAGHAAGNSLNVVEDVPCRVDVLIDVERVFHFHVAGPCSKHPCSHVTNRSARSMCVLSLYYRERSLSRHEMLI